ncbi:MAG: pyrroline-5-carboxylate reductase, partial [Rikenellaceae bacterium]|nr:pyrroline-5-carboxylate reductase [Rikenellaceae bacterium]
AGLLPASRPLPPIFRVIPNTAIALGQSATFICHRGASATHTAAVEGLFGKMGLVFPVEEAQMTAVTALSSCGIAYALRYLDAAARGGVEMGLDSSQSLEIVIQTMRGALKLLEVNRSQPQAEIDRVTTPGGITIKGLEAMERSGFSPAVIEGIKAGQ